MNSAIYHHIPIIVFATLILEACAESFPEDTNGASLLFDLINDSLQTSTQVVDTLSEPGVSLNGTINIFTSELSSIQPVRVNLNTQPKSDVRFDITSSDTTEGLLSMDNAFFKDSFNLRFTTNNWDIPQTVYVRGESDDTVDGDIVYSIILGSLVSADSDYNGLDPSDIAAINFDTDVMGAKTYRAAVSPTSGLVVSEQGQIDQFGVVLSAAPVGTVIIPISSSDTSEVSVSTGKIVFNAVNWHIPISVTVTGVDDSVKDGDSITMINIGPLSSSDPNYSGLTAPSVSVKNLDDEN